jgi:hypothetical protein
MLKRYIENKKDERITKKLKGNMNQKTNIDFPKDIYKNNLNNENYLFKEEIQKSINNFRKISQKELYKLTKLEGLDIQTAIDILVDKIRTSSFEFITNKEDIQLVMNLAGFSNEKDAVRTLLLREELVSLRNKGFNHVSAIDELVNRMKILSGNKRKLSHSLHEIYNLSNLASTENKLNNNNLETATNHNEFNNSFHINFSEEKVTPLKKKRKKNTISSSNLFSTQEIKNNENFHLLDQSSLFHFLGEYNEEEENENDLEDVELNSLYSTNLEEDQNIFKKRSNSLELPSYETPANKKKAK